MIFSNKYKQIRKLVGPLVTIDNGHIQGCMQRPHIYTHKYLSLGFGFMNGSIPLEIIIDQGFNIIQMIYRTNKDETCNRKLRKLFTKKILKLNNIFLEDIINRLFVVGFVNKPLNIHYFNMENPIKLEEQVTHLETEYERYHKKRWGNKK